MSRTLLLEQIRAILYNLQYALIRIRLKEYVAAITGTRQPAGTKINCFPVGFTYNLINKRNINCGKSSTLA